MSYPPPYGPAAGWGLSRTGYRAGPRTEPPATSLAHFWHNSSHLVRYPPKGHVANSVKTLVPGVGVEPTWARGPRDFKSLASTGSATPAYLNSRPPRLLGSSTRLWRRPEHLALFVVDRDGRGGQRPTGRLPILPCRGVPEDGTG